MVRTTVKKVSLFFPASQEGHKAKLCLLQWDCCLHFSHHILLCSFCVLHSVSVLHRHIYTPLSERFISSTNSGTSLSSPSLFRRIHDPLVRHWRENGLVGQSHRNSDLKLVKNCHVQRLTNLTEQQKPDYYSTPSPYVSFQCGLEWLYIPLTSLFREKNQPSKWPETMFFHGTSPF